MRKPQSGEPNAGEPHVRFGGRGGREPFSTPIDIGLLWERAPARDFPNLIATPDRVRGRLWRLLLQFSAAASLELSRRHLMFSCDRPIIYFQSAYTVEFAHVVRD
jgi:hypothetical protein